MSPSAFVLTVLVVTHGHAEKLCVEPTITYPTVYMCARAAHIWEQILRLHREGCEAIPDGFSGVLCERDALEQSLRCEVAEPPPGRLL